MENTILIYPGAAITVLWGVAHLFPAKNIVKGFEDITADNKNIITMEWINEGAALIFTGIVAAGFTVLGETNITAAFVYVSSSVFLVVLGVISLFTSFRVNFLPFKLCPVLFTLSAVLILIGHFT